MNWELNDIGQAYSIVAAITLALLTILVVIDLIMAFNDVPNDRLNYILHNESNHKGYFIPLLWGMVVGHLFLGKYYTSEADLPITPTAAVIVLAVINLLVIGIGYKFPLKSKYPTFVILTLLIVGVLYGHFFWSMNYPVYQTTH